MILVCTVLNGRVLGNGAVGEQEDTNRGGASTRSLSPQTADDVRRGSNDTKANSTVAATEFDFGPGDVLHVGRFGGFSRNDGSRASPAAEGTLEDSGEETGWCDPKRPNNCPEGYPCENGTCKCERDDGGVLSMACHCPDGWEHDNRPWVCVHCDLPCQHGNCILEQGDMFCSCDWGYEGELCTEKISPGEKSYFSVLQKTVSINENVSRLETPKEVAQDHKANHALDACCS